MWLSIIPPAVGSGCRQMSVATGGRSGGQGQLADQRQAVGGPQRDRLPARGQDRAGGDLGHGLLSGSVRRARAWPARAALPARIVPVPPIFGPLACSGQTTTCATPGRISWSQPGQRYTLVAAAPGTWRTTQSPSGQDCDLRRPQPDRPAPSPSGRGARRHAGWPRAGDGGAAQRAGGGPCGDSRMSPYLLGAGTVRPGRSAAEAEPGGGVLGQQRRRRERRVAVGLVHGRQHGHRGRRARPRPAAPAGRAG